MNEHTKDKKNTTTIKTVGDQDIIFASSTPVKAVSTSAKRRVNFLVGSVRPLRSISRIKSLKKSSILPKKSTTPSK